MLSIGSLFGKFFAPKDEFPYVKDSQFFKNFLAILEYMLMVLSFFVLGLWVVPRFFYIPPGYLDLFYALLWIGVVFEFVIKYFFYTNKRVFLLKEWFYIVLLVFPVLRPLQIFGFSRFFLLILSKEVYSRFCFIRESRILEILLVSSVIVVLSADLFIVFEKGVPGSEFTTFSDAIWFSVVTVATIGYGDIVPVTIEGRILATFLIIFGVSVFGIITGSISSYIVSRKIKSSQRSLDGLLPFYMGNFGSGKSDEILDRLEQIEKKLDGMNLDQK